jgi:hypothetical protein
MGQLFFYLLTIFQPINFHINLQMRRDYVEKCRNIVEYGAKVIEKKHGEVWNEYH